ncbi:hypothetical protein RRG08_046550 [Elysia crispata]|uniref:Uncharacterized protein n=1 Tax=Elysia crispata TaxID=231223 RepID=A0AAE1DB68_9GAST|nr:hypothetical protein RRG08_046550 [Elysia crispata]
MELYPNGGKADQVQSPQHEDEERNAAQASSLQPKMWQEDPRLAGEKGPERPPRGSLLLHHCLGEAKIVFSNTPSF